ncbi:TIGR00730 family Rossman fold protein [Pseudoramibacter alactolyticus]|nr:TIGR00730 family Rossman fold protein [Pseudoramibacter alactolyticus]
MNITVFCGSRFGTDPDFKQAAADLGTWIGKNGHCLIYGSGWTGLMGTVADATLDAGGRVIGVIPEFLKAIEKPHELINKTITVETMAERKTIMRKLGDAFIALPGGPGTMEEITEVISLAKLNRHHKPCVVFNQKGFYDSFKTLYDEMVAKDFLDQPGRDKIVIADSIEAVEAALGHQQ